MLSATSSQICQAWRCARCCRGAAAAPEMHDQVPHLGCKPSGQGEAAVCVVLSWSVPVCFRCCSARVVWIMLR